MRYSLLLGSTVLALAAAGAGPARESDAATGWTLAPSATYATGAEPFALACADFNRDGKLDLAVANGGSGNVSMLRGAGDGTFVASGIVAAGSAISALWAGDATLDGKPDLMVARSNSSDAEFHAGNGDLTFAPPVVSSLSGHPGATDIVVFDWSHDLPPHFALAAGRQFIDGAVRQANGTYAGGGMVSNDFHDPRCLASADMTGDGWCDLVVGGSDATVLVEYRGPYGGGDATEIDPGFDTRAVAAADFDRDGKLDVVAVGSTSPTVAVHRNTWPGAFQLTERPVVGAEGRDVAVADFDGDAVPDLLVVHADGWALLRGSGDCTFSAAQAAGAGTDATAAVAGDFDRDGRPDFAVARRGTNDVEVRLNRVTWKKGGSFQSVAALQVGAMPFEPVVGDLDRDGRPDVVSVAYGGNSMPTFLGAEDGFSDGPVYPTADNPRALSLADLDHDGRLDVVNGSAVGSGVEVRLGTVTGFGEPDSYATGNWPYDSKVADVNRDGHPDIVVSHSWYDGAGVIATLLGAGDGTFGDPIVSYAGVNPSDLELADFDRDGILDVAVANTNLGAASTVSVRLGAGDGSFGPKTDYAVGAAPQQAAAVDLDRDGVLDLVVPNASSATISVLRGRGDGTFDAAVDVPVGPGDSRPVGVVAGDFDRDGMSDVAVADVGLFAVWTFRGLGDLTFAPAVATDTDAIMLYAVSADVLDRDGLPDIVATTYSEGTVRILKNVPAPAPDIAADATDFGTIVLGDTVRAVRDVTIRNRGSLPLLVTGAAIVSGDPGAFAVDWPNGHSIEIAPEGTTAIPVTCSASDPGPCAGVLEVVSNAPDQPALQVALAANPVAYLVTPAIGSIGTTFTYRGELGPKGGAVLLLGRKPASLKTVAWTAGSPGAAVFAFLPKKAKPGIRDLVLKPRKQPSVTWAGAFTVAPPAVLTVEPGSAAAGAPVTVTMQFPGTQRGKVALVDPATKRKSACKVASWTPSAADGGATGTAVFLVAKKLVSGRTYDVVVTNGVGVATHAGAFTAP